MKLFLPKQHGAWAMLIIPFWLGVAASSFMWQHIPFFIGWLFLYLAAYPMLLLFKKNKKPSYLRWTLIYFVPALLLLLIPLWTRPSIVYFGLSMVPFFIINAYYSKRNRDRALLNDMSAICVFAIAGLASSYLAEGGINELTILAFIASILFFIGSTLYVKTMIRERKNPRFKWISWSYHIVILIVWLLLGDWIVTLAFIPSLGRAIYFYGKLYAIKTIGICEIINSVLFFFIMLLRILY